MVAIGRWALKSYQASAFPCLIDHFYWVIAINLGEKPEVYVLEQEARSLLYNASAYHFAIFRPEMGQAPLGVYPCRSIYLIVGWESKRS